MTIDGHFNSAIPFHVYVYFLIGIHVTLILRDAVRYTFGPVLQKELNQFVNDWNTHCIRKSTMAEAPGGIPNVLFHFPGLKGIYIYMHMPTCN